MRNAERGVRTKSGSLRGDRGVALLIVLLVTALLIALVFEFAYGTRVSMRAAVNFRDSQRAEFLAQSAISAFAKYKDWRDSIPQNEWSVMPIISAGDTELRVRWQDEDGKINLNNQKTVLDAWIPELLNEQGIDQNVYERIKGLKAERNNVINLLAELHAALSDEEYDKLAPYLTVTSSMKINVNTASETVLRSVLKEAANNILMLRKDKPIESLGGTGANTANFSTSSNYLKVYSHATVGEYTRQVEAVINIEGQSYNVLYWRAS